MSALTDLDPFACCGGNDETPRYHCSDCPDHPWVGEPSKDDPAYKAHLLANKKLLPKVSAEECARLCLEVAKLCGASMSDEDIKKIIRKVMEER